MSLQILLQTDTALSLDKTRKSRVSYEMVVRLLDKYTHPIKIHLFIPASSMMLRLINYLPKNNKQFNFSSLLFASRNENSNCLSLYEHHFDISAPIIKILLALSLFFILLFLIPSFLPLFLPTPEVTIANPYTSRRLNLALLQGGEGWRCLKAGVEEDAKQQHQLDCTQITC